MDIAMKVTHSNWSDHFSFPPSILLDGVEQVEVLEADEEEGTVTKYKTTPTGVPIYAGGKYLTEVKTGVVRIVGERRTDI